MQTASVCSPVAQRRASSGSRGSTPPILHLRPARRALRPPCRAGAVADSDATPSSQPSSAEPAGSETSRLLTERGMPFNVAGSFFRAQSSQGRDLALLAAALNRRRSGSLRVLDVMSGSGMRAARFLHHASADHVTANDINPNTPLEENLSRVADASRHAHALTSPVNPPETALSALPDPTDQLNQSLAVSAQDCARRIVPAAPPRPLR